MGNAAYTDEFQAGYNRALIDVNGELLNILRNGEQYGRNIRELRDSIGEILRNNITGTLKERLSRD